MKFSSLALIGTASALTTEGGSCPTNLTGIKDLDVKRYVGQWYNIAGDRDNAHQKGGQCITAHYTLKDNGHIAVTNRGWWWYFPLYFHVSADAVCEGTSGNCHVAFMGKKVEDVPVNYQVLKTDYDNYAVVYSCRMEGNKKVENVWLNGRRNHSDMNNVE